MQEGQSLGFAGGISNCSPEKQMKKEPQGGANVLVSRVRQNAFLLPGREPRFASPVREYQTV